MLALELDKTEVKNFMSKLLRGGAFDDFELRVAEIHTGQKITIDGTGTLDSPAFSAWGTSRPLVYEIIKMCAKPRLMKIIFSKKDAAGLHANAAALFLNLLYENDTVFFTTATAQKEFLPEKSLDAAWDAWVRAFFSKEGIAVRDRE